jgi:hypothetical protein
MKTTIHRLAFAVFAMLCLSIAVFGCNLPGDDLTSTADALKGGIPAHHDGGSVRHHGDGGDDNDADEDGGKDDDDDDKDGGD